MLNRKLRHEVFIIRKFHGHIIFILQEIEDIDKWKNSELTGLKVKKQVYNGEYIATFKFKWIEDLIAIRDFPRTTIPFDTYDISPFTLERQLDEGELQLKGIPNQVAYLYATTGNFSVICKTLKEQTGQEWKPMQVKRALQQYIRQTLQSYGPA